MITSYTITLLINIVATIVAFVLTALVYYYRREYFEQYKKELIILNVVEITLLIIQVFIFCNNP